MADKERGIIPPSTIDVTQSQFVVDKSFKVIDICHAIWFRPILERTDIVSVWMQRAVVRLIRERRSGHSAVGMADKERGIIPLSLSRMMDVALM